jgi:cobalt-precorrin-6B (C15)-methyltransferase
MKDSEFIRGKVPMTKEEIRTISIDKLNLSNKNTFLDIGAGTGSISIEVAFKYKNLEVVSIERKDEAIELINKNIEKFNLDNIKVIQGYAPIDINKKFDSIFIGGSGGNLEDVVNWCKSILNENGVLIINCIILDTLYNSLKLLKKYGFKDIEANMVNIARLEKLGEGEYFKPLNPTYIISCKRGDKNE